MKNELTEKQLKEIDSITEKFDSKIAVEQIEIDIYDKKIEELKAKKKLHTDKIKELKKEKARGIVAIKDSERFNKYKKIEIKEGDVFEINLEDCVWKKFGNYNIYPNEDNTIMEITIEGESPTQYRMRVKFDKPVGVQNHSTWSYSREQKTQTLRCNMKMLNAKDFLSEHNKQFKRDVSISNLVD